MSHCYTTWTVVEHIGVQVEEAATMKLARVEIENYRAIETLHLALHPGLTVLHGDNGHGKT
ncbi:MAG: AAA family ATPase, partial [Synechococcus sp. SB0665_bin_28]|nr:AAA family ATPase [Synechococcus sp. SB0665_bin_28]